MTFKDFFKSKTISESLNTDALSTEILSFLEHLSVYQSNHYGNYDSGQLYACWNALPKDMKKQCTPSRNKYANMFRGDDDFNIKPVMSFTWNRDAAIAGSNALFYGANKYSFKDDIKGFVGALDIAKLPEYFGKRLWAKILDQFEIGDDENEILVFGATANQRR